MCLRLLRSHNRQFIEQNIFNKWATLIRFPTATFDDAAQLWHTFKRFPMCFGAVDGTLIPVQLPPYKAITTAPTNFTWAGLVHDARIWRNSDPLNNLMTGISGDKLLSPHR